MATVHPVAPGAAPAAPTVPPTAAAGVDFGRTLAAAMATTAPRPASAATSAAPPAPAVPRTSAPPSGLTLGQMLATLAATPGPSASRLRTDLPATAPGAALAATTPAPGPGPAGTASDLGLDAVVRPLDVAVGSAYGPRTHPIHGDVRVHHGCDMGAPTGTPIHAFAAGTVTFAGVQGGYGNLVVVDHGGGITTRYAHQSAMDVAVGDTVAAGQVLGRVGATGTATGPHLHFEVRRDGASIDPAPYLP